MDVVFTSGIFIHPETAKNHSFDSLQLVVISSRLLSKESMTNLHSKSSKSEKEANNGNLNHKKDCHLVVRLLLSESVAIGHIKLPQSLRLYLGAGLHSCLSWSDDYNVGGSYGIHNVLEKSASEVPNNLLRIISSNPDIDVGDWSMHGKIVSCLSSVSSYVKSGEISAKNEEPNMKVGYRNGISTLLSASCVAQIESVKSNTAEEVSSMFIGCKTLVYVRIKIPTLQRHDKVKTQSNRFSANRNQAEELLVDAIYLLSHSEESHHDEDVNTYEFAFDKNRKDNYSLSLDVLLGKLQFGDLVSFHAPHETTPDILSSDICSLDQMGTAPADVNNSRVENFIISYFWNVVQ